MRDSRKRDFQRSRVYAWENTLPMGQTLTLEECKEAVESAHRLYGLYSYPQILDGRGRRSACGSPQEIRLPRWSRTHRVVLHEAAHAICAALKLENGVAHGPEFVRVCIELWVAFGLGSIGKLRYSARESKVRVAMDPACKPRGR